MAPSPSDAAASVKEAAKGAKDLVPDSVSDPATAASKAADGNPFRGFFGGAQYGMLVGIFRSAAVHGYVVVWIEGAGEVSPVKHAYTQPPRTR